MAEYTLIGMHSSPYTRRVAITLQLYGLDYEIHKSLPFGDAKAKLREMNPAAKIPILLLPDGEVLSESHVILDHLDSLAPATPLTPASGRDRRKVMMYSGIASATADKMVTVLYEYHFRPPEMVFKPWIKMCEQQVRDGFVWLDSKISNGRFVGDTLTQADVSAAVYWQFAFEKRPSFCQRMNCTKLQALSDELARTPAFQATPPEGPLPDGLALGEQSSSKG